MADQINVSGLVRVKFEFKTSGSWAGGIKTLGESMDMVDVEERVFTHNVPGDRYGGPQGPPIEQQWLGEIHVVRMELSRWDPTVWNVVRRRGVRENLGSHQSGDVGALMLASRSCRLILDCPTRPFNYPCALINSSLQYSKGTKFSSVALQVECHVAQQGDQAGILFNSDTTQYTT